MWVDSRPPAAKTPKSVFGGKTNFCLNRLENRELTQYNVLFKLFSAGRSFHFDPLTRLSLAS